MNKLYFILPVLWWVACYFIWTTSAQFITTPALTSLDVAKAIWWFFTDAFAGAFGFLLAGAAITKNL